MKLFRIPSSGFAISLRGFVVCSSFAGKHHKHILKGRVDLTDLLGPEFLILEKLVDACITEVALSQRVNGVAEQSGVDNAIHQSKPNQGAATIFHLDLKAARA